MARRFWRVGLATVGLGLPAVAVFALPSKEARSEPGAVASATPPGARLALIKTSYPGRSLSPYFDLITTNSQGRQRQLVAGRSKPGSTIPTSGPSWSPDGELLAFGGSKRLRDDRSQPSDIYLIGADGTGLRRLTGLGDAFNPVFSSDGHSVAFSRVRSGRQFFGATIWMIGTDGTRLRRITPWTKGVLDLPASFSPQVPLLGFTRAKCHAGFVFTCNSTAKTLALDSLAESLLARRASDPAFSPGGTRIALVSYRDRNGEIRTGSDESEYASELYVMAADGSGKTRLTRTEGLDERTPSWDPSGERIVFGRGGRRFTSRIVQINADGTCKQMLLRSRKRSRGADYDAPSWRPGPGRAAGRIAC